MQTVKGGNSIEKGSIICVQVKSSEKLFGDEAITLPRMAQKLGYSEFYISRKFREISGITVCVVILPNVTTYDKTVYLRSPAALILTLFVLPA